MRLFLIYVCFTALALTSTARAAQGEDTTALHPKDRDMIIIPPNLPQIHGVKIKTCWGRITAAGIRSRRIRIDLDTKAGR